MKTGGYNPPRGGLEKSLMLKMKLIFDVHQHGNTSVVTSDFVFYFHALMQILCKIT